MKKNNPFTGITIVKDRHGKRRYRFRMKGKPSCYINAEYASKDFVKQYETALAGKIVINEINEVQIGTFNWLITRYMDSPKYHSYSKAYKHSLTLQFERFQRSFGNDKFTDLRAAHVEAMMSRKSKKPAAANNLLKMLRIICRYAVKHNWLERDPTIGIEKYKTNPDGFYTWTEADIAQFEHFHGADSKAVLAMRLILFTGAARQDVIRIGWQNIKNERIEYKRGKTGQEVSLSLSLMPELTQVLDNLPRSQLLFITHNAGRGYTTNSFGNWFKDQCNAAGLFQCTSHGLRKAGATRLANAAATEFEVMAFLGHKTPNEARTYVKKANRHILADSAFQKRMNVSNPVQRLDIKPRN